MLFSHVEEVPGCVTWEPCFPSGKMAQRPLDRKEEPGDVVVADAVQHFAACSPSLDKQSCVQLFRLVESCKAALKERAASVLEDGMPFLMQFSCDTTKVVSKQIVSKRAKDMRVARSGQQTQEYMVAEVFVTAARNTGSDLQHTIVFRDPFVLQHGKTMAALVGCAVKVPGMTLVGSEASIRIRHQVHDRGITQRFVSAISGYWHVRAGRKQHAGELAKATARDDNLMEWHCWVGCSAHDGHNALKWSHASIFNNTELLENLYVGISALQASFFNALDLLGTWILEKLSPMSSNKLPAPGELFVLWCAMSVEEPLAKKIADAQILWHDGRLVVEESFLEQGGWLEALSAYLLALWRFKKFTHSRWVTVGTSCRALCCGVLTGYMDLVQFLHSRGAISEYTWHGCQKLQPDVLRCSAILSLTAYISEEFLRGVLSDSRVAKTQDQLAQSLQNEFDFLDFLPNSSCFNDSA